MHGLVLILLLAAPKSVALLALTPNGVEPNLALAFDDLLAAALERANVGKIVTPADIKALLDLAESRQLQGCDSAQCMAEITQALGATHAVRGTLSLLDNDELVLSLSYIHAQSSEVLRRAQRRVTKGGDYAATVAECVSELLNRPIGSARWVGPTTAPVYRADANILALQRNNIIRRQRDMTVSGAVFTVAGAATLVAGIVVTATLPGLAGITKNEYAALAAAKGDDEIAFRTRALMNAVAQNNRNAIAGPVLIGGGALFTTMGVLLLALTRVLPVLEVTSNEMMLGMAGTF